MSIELEVRRQQLLLQALWPAASGPTVGDAAGRLQPWLRQGPLRPARGLAAYRANGEALAARALAVAFPTVQALMGDEDFVRLAKAHWRRHPPSGGDMACYGEALPAALADDVQLADWPYLADCARLDWAVHRAEAAADGPDVPAGWDLLGSEDPAVLRLLLQPAATLLRSTWPVGTLWLAHHAVAEAGSAAEVDRFAAAREALAQGRAESVAVWRRGWRAELQILGEAEVGFIEALLQGQSLAVALTAAGTDFDFEAWLLQALRGGRLAAVQGAGAATAGGL